MLGNDIVDLQFAKVNSRWQEQRFLDKLFTTEEQDFILSDGNRFENIWRLWSMKESAYKIISRADGIVRFNPKAYKCTIKNYAKGVVDYENISISTFTEKDVKFIHTTAFLNTNWTSEVLHLSDSEVKFQHIDVKQHAIRIYADLKHSVVESIDIRKNATGVPQFYKKGLLQKEQLSLTHHGNFGACVIAV